MTTKNTDTKNTYIVLSETNRKRSMVCVIICAMMSVLGASCVAGNVLNLLALKLGAGELYLGLLGFVLMAPTVFRIFTMNAIERVGKRKVMLCWLFVAVAVGACLLIVPLLAGRVSAKICLILILVISFARRTTESLGMTGWFPLLHDIVPESSIGRFFALLRMAWQGTNLIGLFAIAYFMGDSPGWDKFTAVLLVGSAALLIKALALIPVAENPPRGHLAKAINIRDRFKTLLREKSLRPILTYIAVYMMAAMMAEPFKIKLLCDLGYGTSFILQATAMISVGAIATLWMWGKLADKFGNRPIFSISHVGMIMVSFLWILVDKSTFGAAAAFTLFLLGSVFNSGNGIAQTRYLLHAVPKDQQNHINIVNMISVLVTALAPLVGGAFLAITSNLHFEHGAVSLNNYHMLFLLTGMLFIIPHILRRRLGTKKDAPTSRVFAFATQTLRGIFGPFFRVAAKDETENDRQE